MIPVWFVAVPMPETNKQTYGKRPNNNNALHSDFRGRSSSTKDNWSG
jgi:hypothetical protein